MHRLFISNKKPILISVSIYLLITMSCTSIPEKSETINHISPGVSSSGEKPPKDTYEEITNSDDLLETLNKQDWEEMDPETQLIYAILLSSQGQLDDSKMILKALIRNDPSMGTALLHLALVEDAGGNEDARDKALDSAIQADSDLVEALVFRADLAVERSQFTKAEKDYSHALKLEPENVESLVGLAWVYAKNDKKERALTLLSEALEIDSTYIYARVDRARVNVSLSNYEDAEDDLDEVIALEPNVEWHYLDRARLRLAYIKDFEGALSDLTIVEEMNPDNFLAMIYLAGLHEEQRRFASSYRYYKKVLERHPDYIDAYASMGKLSWMAGNYSEAARWFEKASADNPDEFSLQLMGALSLLRSDRRTEARVMFAETLRRFKSDETAYSVVRFCSERSSDVFAVNALNREGNKVLRNRLWYYMGAIYEYENNHIGSKAVFEKISELKGRMEYDLAWAALNGMGD